MAPPEIPESPHWNRTVKTIVAVSAILFILVVLWRFQTLIRPLIIAIILAYLLNPVIIFIDRHTRLNRGTVTGIVYATLAVTLVGFFIVIGVGLYNQVISLIDSAPEIIANFPEQIENLRLYLSQPISFGGTEFRLPLGEEGIDWQDVSQAALGYVEPYFGDVTGSLGGFVIGTLSALGWLVFILFVSIYISNDIPRIGEMIGGVATAPGYRKDAERLWRDFGRIWNAYLRGQVILGLVIFVVVSVTLVILGVENALALGLLSGLLEFIPVVGPIIGAAAAVLVALFQTDVPFGLTSFQFGLVVLIAMIIIQQIENSVLVPRIVGDALDLHPILVLVGAIMGSSLAGILGAILAAPVIASIKLIGTYAWRKMFDLPPFQQPEPDDQDEASWLERFWERRQLRRAQASLADEE